MKYLFYILKLTVWPSVRFWFNFVFFQLWGLLTLAVICFVFPVPVGTPKSERIKRARSVTSDQGLLDDDARSVSSTTSAAGGLANGPVRPSSARKTPAQVKAEAAARKAKVGCEADEGP